MAKIINGDISRLQAGLNAVADAVKVTIGPRGKNVIIDNSAHPIIANDGGLIAKEIVLKDPIENMGASLIKGVIQKTSEDVGGGRTASAIIMQALVSEGLKLINKGFSPNLLKKGMQLAVKDIHAELDKMARKVKGKDLEKIAIISTENEELGKVIAETIEKIGVDGVVTVEESQSVGISTEIAEGLKFDRGWLSPYMVTDRERMEAIFEDIPVIIFDKKISSFMEIKPITDQFVTKKLPSLLLIAEDVDESVLKGFAFMRFNGMTNILAIKTPGVGDNKKFTLEDLCALTGAEVVSDIKQVKVGRAKKVISKKDSTEIRGSREIKTWLTTLRTRQAMTENKWEIDQYKERIAKLLNGIAVIKVGASSEAEVKYLKLKIEDGVNEAKRALEEGIVVGGNVALIHASAGEIKEDGTKDERRGYEIVMTAIQAPLRQIVENSNGSPDVVVNAINHSHSLTVGYNSLDNEVVDDMYALGIIDAVKVTKTVLQNAVSAASMFLSIELSITEELKDD